MAAYSGFQEVLMANNSIMVKPWKPGPFPSSSHSIWKGKVIDQALLVDVNQSVDNLVGRWAVPFFLSSIFSPVCSSQKGILRSRMLTFQDH